MIRDPNRCSTHPGVFLREVVIPSVDFSAADIAGQLQISTQQLAAILDGKRPIEADTTVHLEALFGRSAEAWLKMQNAHDIWRAQRAVD